MHTYPIGYVMERTSLADKIIRVPHRCYARAIPVESCILSGGGGGGVEVRVLRPRSNNLYGSLDCESQCRII